MGKSKVLIDYRKKHGVSQGLMAKALDIPLRTYQSWELGHKVPTRAGLAYIQFILKSKEFERKLKKEKKAWNGK